MRKLAVEQRRVVVLLLVVAPQVELESKRWKQFMRFQSQALIADTVCGLNTGFDNVKLHRPV